MIVYIYPEQSIVAPPDAAVLAAIEALGPYDVVDQIDSSIGPLMSVASNNIPGNASNPLQLVASLAADTKRIKIVEDIGEYMGLYTGAATSEVLKAILPLGGGEFEMELAAGTRVSIRSMKASAISSATFLAINFLG